MLGCDGEPLDAGVPEGKKAMSASSANPPTPEAAAQAGASKGWRGKSRDRLKFLGTRRGDGVLLYAPHSIPVTYELDVFSLGDTRSVRGALRGDFTAVLSGDADGGPATRQARVRLDDGREIDIDLTEMEDVFADFEGSGASVGIELLP